MIKGLNPYPHYKYSGHQWLGQIPSNWSLVRTKRIYRLRTEKSSRGHGLELLSIYTHIGVRPRKDLEQKGNKASTTDGYWIVRKGDIIVNKLLAWMGAVGVSHHDGVTSPAYDILRQMHDLHSDYYHHLFRTELYLQQFKSRSRGIMEMRLRLYFDQLGQIPVLVPSVPEQIVIVRFLDHVNRRIDRYIRAKRTLIVLLNEQKQAIIHRAVTRGLDPNVRLKPSGIPWLGDIPEHWKTLRVKQCAYKISKGTTPSTEGRAILESGPVRFIKAENVSGGTITETPLCFIDEQTNKILLRSQLRENDVLFVIAGATLGKIAIVSKESLPANTNQAVAFIRPNQRVTPAYLGLWLQSPRIKELIWLNAVQSAQPNLSMSDLGNFVVPVPSIEEQSSILKFASAEVSPIQGTITRAEREIALMRDYRTRLVADVVTGQIDVRAAVAKLPEEPEAKTELVAESTVDEDEPSEFEDMAGSGTIR